LFDNEKGLITVFYMSKKEQMEELGSFESVLLAYTPLVIGMVNHYSSTAEVKDSQPEFGDLRQEAELALYRAYCSYNGKQDQVTFGLYAKVCIRNALVSEIRKMKRAKKHELDAMNHVKNSFSFSESFPFDLQKDENLPIFREIRKILSDFEYEIFQLSMVGKKPREIAVIMNQPVKSIWNATARYKQKIKPLIQNNIGHTPKGYW